MSQVDVMSVDDIPPGSMVRVERTRDGAAAAASSSPQAASVTPAAWRLW